jgi:LacI family transcriptional regulator
MKKSNYSTIANIADYLNLSISTVSRALTGKSKEYRISEKTTKLIFERAKQVNYKPNQLARGLRLQKSNTIGVIVPDITNPFFAVIVRWIENAAHKNDVTILISDSNNQTRLEKSAIMAFAGRQIDGLIIAPIGHKSAHVSEIKAMGIPVVLIDRDLGGLDAPFIGSDNYQGAKEATQYLIENGHRKIGFNQGFQKSSANQDRIRGHCEALKESGINVDYDLIVGDDFSEESGYKAAKYLLNGSKEISAIFAAGNPIALGSIRAIKEENLSIPDDISLLSFDDQPYCNYFSPPLSSVAQQTKEIGQMAFKILNEIVEHNLDDTHNKIFLPTKLIIRESVKNFRVQN